MYETLTRGVNKLAVSGQYKKNLII